jgi:hypothetical protein
VTLNPYKLSNCDNSTPLAFLFPKCPHHIFYFFEKKNHKKINSLCWGGRTTSRPPQHLYIFVYLFIYFCFGWGHFENKKAKGVELPQFESLRGLSVTLETLEVKVQIDGYFKEVKCNFPIIIIIIIIFFPNNNTNNIFSQSPSPVSLVIEIDKAVSTMKFDLIKNYCS